MTERNRFYWSAKEKRRVRGKETWMKEGEEGKEEKEKSLMGEETG